MKRTVTIGLTLDQEDDKLTNIRLKLPNELTSDQAFTILRNVSKLQENGYLKERSISSN